MGTDGVVLVHSLAMDRLFWQPVARRLANSAPVLLYDCRRHGESDKPGGPTAIIVGEEDYAMPVADRIADDLLALLARGAAR